MSRSLGGTNVTSRPPISTLPPSSGSSPASIRSAVVLPDPDHELAVADIQVEGVDRRRRALRVHAARRHVPHLSHRGPPPAEPFPSVDIAPGAPGLIT